MYIKKKKCVNKIPQKHTTLTELYHGMSVKVRAILNYLFLLSSIIFFLISIYDFLNFFFLHIYYPKN